MNGQRMVSNRILIIIVALFHFVGLIGFAIPALVPLFLQLVPFHLLLMLAVLLYSHESFSGKFLLFALLIFIAGFTAEWIGVHTGLLFGSYAYGKTLGTKVFDIPLMIGVNWLLLIYAAGTVLQHSGIKQPVVRIALGAVVLVLLDYLIEPVAILFDYWQWQSAGIPLKNYICWFLVSALMLAVFELFLFKKQGFVGLALLIAQFVFFIVLRWV
ncbi:hypothetical protein GCM10023149_45660 [Mucilaginibacter gynuensis]|uniref:Carotenoid biosynthesis protein n=2 Tax=Mucilaginibacter gynuensis TaxID=1302236 RepID=A0ABP8HAG8_9SPHI